MSVVESGNQIEAQVEAFSAIAVGAAQDGKAFEPADNVFDHQALLSKSAVFLFLFWRKRIVFAFLVRCA